MFQNPNDETLKKILESTRTIAMVGLSDNPSRDSYHVAQYLQQHGYRVIPVNPAVDEVLGEKAVATLSDLDEPVDLIDVFRRSDAVKEIVQSSLDISAPVIWTQLGVADEKAANLATEHGKAMIMDKCIKIEHARLIGR
jgi:uncharacterized protein